MFAHAPGAIAAPTAGLHFTPEMLAQFEHTFLTLHVGIGTFRPVKVENVEDHPMHAERFTVSEEAAAKMRAADRIVAVGTTVVRTLETLGEPRAATGKTLWKQERPTDAEDESTEAYITPVPVTVAGRREVVVVGGECVTGHEAVTGAETWRWWFTPPDRKIWQRVVVSPVMFEDLLVVVRPKHRPVFALKLGGQGKLGDDILAWEHKEATPDVPSPLVYRDRLYLLDDTKKILTCCEPKTGRVIWAEKLPTTSGYYASPTGADGKVYCISRTGEVVVVAAADRYQVLATINMGEGPCHASPVAAAGRLLIRTGQKLYCIGETAARPQR